MPKKFELGIRVDEVVRGMPFGEGIVVHSLEEIRGQYLLTAVTPCREGNFIGGTMLTARDIEVLQYAFDSQNGTITSCIDSSEKLKMQTCIVPRSGGFMGRGCAIEGMSTNYSDYKRTLEMGNPNYVPTPESPNPSMPKRSVFRAFGGQIKRAYERLVA